MYPVKHVNCSSPTILVILTSLKAWIYTTFCGLIHEHVENLMGSLLNILRQREVMRINFKNLIQIEQLKSNNPSTQGSYTTTTQWRFEPSALR